jgi:hypothetical protein
VDLNLRSLGLISEIIKSNHQFIWVVSAFDEQRTVSLNGEERENFDAAGPVEEVH